MITREEFLERRGDRSLRLGYGGKCPADEVALVLRPTALPFPAVGPAVVAAANLLGRWVPRLSVCLPRDTGRAFRSLETAIEEAVGTANPFLDVRWGRPRAEQPALVIGPGPASRGEVTAWADDWVAISTTRTSLPCHSGPTTSVLLFSVALAVGRVFRQAWCLASDGPEEVRWNTWRHTLESKAASHRPQPPPNRPPTLGRVLQVGAGAVGSNIIYFLGLMGTSADLALIDHDVVKIENLDRSLLFGLRHAHPRKLPKVEAAVGATECFPTLRVQPVQAKWSEYMKTTYRVGHFDLAFALANEDQVWPAMASAVLPLTLQATTDEDWGVAFGAHAPGTAYCLRCRFPPDTQLKPTICSEGPIRCPFNQLLRLVSSRLRSTSSLLARSNEPQTTSKPSSTLLRSLWPYAEYERRHAPLAGTSLKTSGPQSTAQRCSRTIGSVVLSVDTPENSMPHPG